MRVIWDLLSKLATMRMSPHAVTSSECSITIDGSFWKHFGITKNGFLPSKAPLRKLPSEYYLPWEILMQDLPGLLKNGSLCYHVDRLPILSVDGLHTEAQVRRAYVILGFLTHAYIWGGDTASEVGCYICFFEFCEPPADC